MSPGRPGSVFCQPFSVAPIGRIFWPSRNSASSAFSEWSLGSGSSLFRKTGLISALPSILYAGLCSGGIAFTLQIVALKYTPAAEAALIMSLESVFAALSAVVLLSERLTEAAILGGGLILLGVVLVEAGPAMQNIRLSQFWGWLTQAPLLLKLVDASLGQGALGSRLIHSQRAMAAARRAIFYMLAAACVLLQSSS